MYKFDWSILWGEWGLLLIDGLIVTLQLAAWSLTFAMLIGLVVGVVRWRGIRFLEPFCWVYVEFARNIPPLVQILFWYFSASYILPDWLFSYMRNVGYEFAAAVVALSVYHGSFIAEVIRSGLNAIHRGQYEASRALGLSFMQMMMSVITPQAVRVIIPPLTNEAVGLVKNTTLALAIGVTEIAYQTKYIGSYTFRGVEALCAATVLYLVVCLGLAGLSQLAEKHFSRHVSKRVGVQPTVPSE